MNQGHGNRIRRYLALSLLVAAVFAISPATASAADGDLTTTTSVTVADATEYDDYRDHIASVIVDSETDIAPVGVVVFALDGAEVGRAVLTPGSTFSRASIFMEISAGTDRSITATYLGGTGFVSSSHSAQITVTESVSGHPATGELRIGDANMPIVASQPLLRFAPKSDPITGVGSAQMRGSAMSITEDVPGAGPVTVVFGVLGSISLDVDSTGSVTGSMSLTLRPRRVTVDGITWAAACSSPSRVTGTATGEVSGDLLTLAASGSASTSFGPTDCGGYSDVLNALLIQPLALGITTQGTFPLPPPEGTPTNTTVTVEGTSWDATSPLRIFSRVDSSYGQVRLGSVTISVNGIAVATYGAGATGPYTYVGPLEPGPVEITATYAGASPFAGSSGTTTVTIDPPPDGIELAGEFALGPNRAPLPEGSVLTEVDFDPGTGAFSAASLWTPRGSIPVDTGIIGIVDLVYRVRSLSPLAGVVAPDGVASLDPASLSLEILGYSQDLDTQPISSLTNCILTPMTADLTGTAGIDGLTLQARDVPRPALPSGGCSGLASFIAPRLGTTFDVELSVAGDYRFGVEDTELSVSSWLPAVDQHNQTLLVATATADTTPSGTVAFYDGETMVGEATLGPSGVAATAATLDAAGNRTIEARYLGNPTHRRATATTTVEVRPTPGGLSVEGSLSVGATELPIGEGSVLEPQQPAAPGTSPVGAMRAAIEDPGARLWFDPTTIDLTVAGYGPVTAEVRLVQNGRMTPTDIRPDGTFSGLFGAFGLHVRSVTTADGVTTRPLGCINVVLLVLDGQLRLTDARLQTAGGGSAPYRNAACTGIGRAVANTLANRTVTLDATVNY